MVEQQLHQPVLGGQRRADAIVRSVAHDAEPVKRRDRLRCSRCCSDELIGAAAPPTADAEGGMQLCHKLPLEALARLAVPLRDRGLCLPQTVPRK